MKATFSILGGFVQVRAEWTRDEMDILWFEIGDKRFKTFAEFESYVELAVDREIGDRGKK